MTLYTRLKAAALTAATVGAAVLAAGAPHKFW